MSSFAIEKLRSYVIERHKPRILEIPASIHWKANGDMLSMVHQLQSWIAQTVYAIIICYVYIAMHMQAILEHE